MPIRIICLEEHLLDPDLANATNAAYCQDAPYWFDQGTLFREDPDNEPQDRPRNNAPQRAMELTRASPEERLRAMDADGIDVQVLSYPHATQGAPAAMARAANDRLAEVARQHPARLAGF